jgi:hypothetical protein
MYYLEENNFILDHIRNWPPEYDIVSDVRFDPVMIDVLNKWLNRRNHKVVISSRWAHHYHKHQIVELLRRNGFRHYDKLHEFWETTTKNSSRGKEIAAWLNSYNGNVANYMVIDDDESVLDGSVDKDKVLLVDSRNGISYTDVMRGCDILGIHDYNVMLK